MRLARYDWPAEEALGLITALVANPGHNRDIQLLRRLDSRAAAAPLPG
jgi:hypothetical protein